jgi:hypothetical protein
MKTCINITDLRSQTISISFQDIATQNDVLQAQKELELAWEMQKEHIKNHSDFSKNIDNGASFAQSSRNGID